MEQVKKKNINISLNMGKRLKREIVDGEIERERTLVPVVREGGYRFEWPLASF